MERSTSGVAATTRDLMAGVDDALKKNSWIDPTRLGVGRQLRRFHDQLDHHANAAIQRRCRSCESERISFYSTSLYQDLIHAEFGGFPWDNFELLWQWSPLRCVRQVQTPTLFIHENDNDVTSRRQKRCTWR